MSGCGGWKFGLGVENKKVQCWVSVVIEVVQDFDRSTPFFFDNQTVRQCYRGNTKVSLRVQIKWCKIFIFSDISFEILSDISFAILSNISSGIQIFLTFLLTYFLTFFFTYLLTFSLTYLLTFFLTYLLTIFLTYLLIFFLTSF